MADFLSGYTRRKKINLDKSNSDLIDFPLLVRITDDEEIGAVAKANGFDLRFTSADGVTPLAYERESFSVTASPGQARFYKVPIVIDKDQVGAGGVTNFPFLVTEAVLEWSAQHEAIWSNSQNGGGDLIFTSDEAGIQRLPCEVVSYNTTSKTCEVWVLVPTVSSAVDTTIYLWFCGTGSEVQPDADAAYGSEAVWVDYAAVYHLSDCGAGAGTVADSTGNNDGTNAGATDAAGKVGRGCRTIAASNQFIALGTAQSLGPPAITVSCWIKAASFISNYRTFVGRAGGGWELLVHTTQLAFYGNGVSGTYSYDPGTHVLEADVWYHATLTYSSDIGLIGYLNAEIDGTGESKGSIVQNEQAAVIGAEASNFRQWDGDIDELRIAPTALSPAQITSDYNNQNNPGQFSQAGEVVVPGAAATGVFWVKTGVSSAGTTIYLYYGKLDAVDGENAEEVWDVNYKAVYHLSDCGAGAGTVYDSTVNANNGTNNGALDALGRIGRGGNFGGGINTSTLLVSSGPKTISMWIEANFSEASQYLFDTENGRLIVAYGNSGDPHIGYYDGSWHAIAEQPSSEAWHHIAFSLGSSGSVFVDGLLVGSDTYSDKAIGGQSAIGVSYPLAGAAFGGLLDEIRISSIARSSDWISYEYSNQNSDGLTWFDEENTEWLSSYPHRKKLILSSSASDLVDFPLLVRIEDDGDIGASARADGYDIRFTTINGFLLPYERESFSITDGSANGIFWVKTNVSSSTNTEIYIYYGRFNAVDGNDAVNVWDADYKAVYHMSDCGAGAGTVYDSTINSNDGTNNGVVDVAGKVGRGSLFGYTYISFSEIDLGTANSISVWVKNMDVTGNVLIGGNGWEYVSYFSDSMYYCANAAVASDAGSVMVADVWYHLSFVRSGVSVTFYRDGQQFGGNKTLSGALSLSLGAIGAYSSGGYSLVRGCGDEIRISSIARSADWILYEYTNQNTGGITWEDEETTYWLPDYPYRKKITLAVSTEDLTDFPLLVKISADTDIGTLALATGYDIRFTSDNGVTLLPYEKEDFAIASNSATGDFWVKTNVSSAIGTVIYLYYGNPNAADGQDIINVWDANYKAVYHMNDCGVGSGTVYDSTSNSNDGTNNGAVDVAGKVGRGGEFGGTNEYVDVGLPLEANSAGTKLFQVWLKADAPGYRYLMSNYDAGSNGFSCIINDNRSVGISWTGVLNIVQTTDVLTIGDWYHLTCLWESGVLGGKIYINGLLSLAGDLGMEQTCTDNVRLSGRWDTPNVGSVANFDGLLDEIRISSIARSAGWILYEYNNQNTGGLTWENEENTGWLPSYGKRKEITLGTSVSDLTDFPLLVKVVSDTDIGASARADGYDIRFTANDGTTLLPYERESFSIAAGAATGIFWVKTNVSCTSGTKIYLYYGRPNATDGQDTVNVWDADYKAVYHMSDCGAGVGTVYDSTSNNNDGTNAGAIDALGKVGRCGGFAGGVYIDTPSPGFPIIGVGQTTTVSIWVKLSSNAQAVFIEQSSGGPRFVLWWFTGANALNVWCDGYQKYGPALTVGVWYHVAVCLNGSACTLYMDGVPYGEPVAYTAVDCSGTVRFGLDKTDGSSPLTGGEDEIRISSIARSPDWISYEYTNQNTGNISWGVEEGIEWLPNYDYRKKLTLDLPDSDLTDFPLLISIVADTDIGLAARSDGYDIRFTTSNGVNLLSYERESFSISSYAATGIFWVKTNVSSSANTEIYIYYGKSDAVDGQDTVNVWDADYRLVNHMGNGVILDLSDSTSHANDGTVYSSGATATAGHIGGSVNFNGDGYIGGGADWPTTWPEVTLSAFVTATVVDSILFQSSSDATGWGLRLAAASYPSFYTRAVADNLFTDITIASTVDYWLAVTFNDVANSASMWAWNINTGVLQSQTISVTTSPSAGNGAYLFGKLDVVGYNLIGEVDELHISSIARSADWISYEYNNQNSGGVTWSAQEAQYIEPSPAYLTGYSRRRQISLLKSDSDLIDFPLLVRINNDTDIGALAKSNGYDIRFTSSDGVTLLPYEREDFSITNSVASGDIWVKTGVSSTSKTIIYMYYGNPSAVDGENAVNVWDVNYKAVYHMNDCGAGAGTVYDSTINANNGTNAGAVDAVGKVGRGGDFSSDYINVGSGETLRFANNQSFSIGAWLHVNNYDVVRMIFGTVSDPFNGYAFYLNSSEPQLQFQIDAQNLIGYLQVNANLASNTDWQLLYCSYSGNYRASGISLYQNGQVLSGIVGSDASLESNAIAYNCDAFIGDYGSAAHYLLTGLLDELRISSIARSPDWISYEYKNQQNGAITWGMPESSNDWLPGWSCRKTVTISHTNIDSDLVDFPLLVRVNDVEIAKYAKSNGYDIRFTTDDGITILPYERESYTVPSIQRKCPITIDHTLVGTGGVTNFPFLVTEACLPSDIFQTAQNDAGDLRFFDSLGTRLACEIVSFDKNAGTAEIWVLVPTISDATDTVVDVWWAGNGFETQPAADEAYGSEAVWVDYSAVYHLSDCGTGTGTVADSTGNNDGTNNGATDVAGKVGRGGGFGGSRHIDLPDNTLAVDNDYTISGWGNRDGGVGYQGMFSTSQTDIFLGTDTSGNAYAQTVIGDVVKSVTGGSITSGIHYILLEKSSITGLSLYLDGEYVGTAAESTGDSDKTGVLQSIGYCPNLSLYYWFGTLDETRISSTALSAAQILTDYNNQNNPGAFASAGTVEKIDVGLFWVKTNLSSSSDTTLYIYYGNSSAIDGQNPTAVWDSNYKGVWHMSDCDAGAGTVYDSTINDNDGTNAGAVDAEGMVGRGGSFDGVNHFIRDASFSSQPTGNASFSVSVWVKLNTLEGNPYYAHPMVTFGADGVSPTSYGLSYSAGKPFATFASGNGQVTGSSTMLIDRWYYLTSVYDETTNKVYLNGVIDGDVNYSGASLVSGDLNAGVWSQYPTTTFNGLLDEIRISSVARSADWIKFEYYNISGEETTFGDQEQIIRRRVIICINN